MKKTSVPGWVNKVAFKNDSIKNGSGGEQYLLIDRQTNIPSQARFVHFAVKLLNADGVQDNSDISVIFDPSYQKILFHKIQVIRDGKVLNKLQLDKIKIIQRESNMERSMYDGSLTAILHLTDVRENDIIEYSFTRIGLNPINQGNYGTSYNHQFSVPVNRIYNRIISDAKHPVEYKLFEQAVEPTKKKSSFGNELIWDVAALDNLPYETNVPAWYNPYMRVAVSTYGSWANFVKLYEPLYKVNARDAKIIYQSIKKELKSEPEILDLIRFVQNNIRYLGLEDGISAYKPNPPRKVYQQRYGDCKDKSLLLCALLREKGIEAYPFLVHTVDKYETVNAMPGPNAFNHCIVNLKVNGKEYYIDPTISNQGGDLEHTSTPDYKYGIKIKRGETQLTKMPEVEPATLSVTEHFTLDSINGNSKYRVVTKYTGSRADAIRSDFDNGVHESIQKSYLDFYSGLYPHIEANGDIEIIDDSIKTTNLLTVVENYFIKDIWEENDDKDMIYCRFHPMVLESMTGFTKSVNQKMPYYLGNPVKFEQKTIVTLPEDWSFSDAENKMENTYFTYSDKMSGVGRVLTCQHSYELLAEYIPGDYIENFLVQIEEIEDEYSHYITYNLKLTESKTSPMAVGVFMLAFLVAIVLGLILFFRYNPINSTETKLNTFGGWLIFPMIGLILTPLVNGFQLFSVDFFGKGGWENVIETGMEQKAAFLAYCSFEMIFNTFLWVFSIFLLILFLKKRTSVPRLMMCFYAFNFVFLLADLLIAEFSFSDVYTDAELEEAIEAVAKSFITGAVWIPYFKVSTRVKETFHKRLKK